MQKLFLIKNNKKIEIERVLEYPDIKNKTSIFDNSSGIIVLETVSGEKITNFNKDDLFFEENGKLTKCDIF